MLSFNNEQATTYHLHKENEDFSDNEDAPESSDEEGDRIIHPPPKSLKVTPCVIIDNDNDERTIQRCNREEGARSVHQLVGTWEVDREAVKQLAEVRCLPSPFQL